MSEKLNIGLLHLEVLHKRTRENRAALVNHARRAAEEGAQVILAPELAVSGYSFQNREDVAGQVEVLQGETFEMLAQVAEQHGVIICTGFAERDPVTDIYYNSAVTIRPDGSLAAFHRKIAAERRWACPGSPSAANIFDTPWGRMGVLICADTYYGLLPRSMALQGVDLLLVAANWPPSGLDPRKVWRARALENGMGVVACNRTGVDRHMDCREGSTYAVDHGGEILLDGRSETSRVWHMAYPLTEGRLFSHARRKVLGRRRPEEFASLYLHVNGLQDFSGLWGLPPGGLLTLCCLAPASGKDMERCLERLSGESDGNGHTLLVLPRGVDPHFLEKFVQGMNENMAVVAGGGVWESSAPTAHPFFAHGGRRIPLQPRDPCVQVDFGPARLALVRHETLEHPEAAVSLSKEGCDVLVAPDVQSLHEDARLLLGVKSLERAVAVGVAPDGGIICEPPEGHAPWKETAFRGTGMCSASVDTKTLRRKTFQDRVDMKTLLRRPFPHGNVSREGE